MELEDVLQHLERQIARAGSAKAWCATHDLSQQFISDVRRGARYPSERVLDALGFEALLVYRRKTLPADAD